MDLSINFDFLSNFLNSHSNPYPKLKIFVCILNYLIRNLQNIQTQTQNPNTQKIENPNPNLNLLVLLGAHV